MLDALRLGVHQLLSTRVASHAAVNESVELARAAAGRAAAGFANAVLRRVSRDTPGDWMTRVAEGARSDDERLGLLFSHPVWVVRAFRRALAAEGRAAELEALLTADNAAPRVTMAALPDLAEVPDDARRTPYSPIGFRLGGGDPDATIRGSGGRLRVQDEGSQLAALALTRATPVAEGELWLDLCAGPGGKTAVLAAEALRHGIRLEANEISPARAGLVRQALAGVPLEVPVSEQDGRVRADESPRPTTASWSTRPAPGSARCAGVPRRAGASLPPTCPSSPSCRASCSRRPSAPSSPAASSRTSPARRTSPRPQGSWQRCAGNGVRRWRSSTRAPSSRPSPTRIPTCRRRAMDRAVRSCGRTVTTPTRCRSRCCDASEARRAAGSLAELESRRHRRELLAQGDQRRGMQPAELAGIQGHDRALGDARGDVAQHRDDAFRAGEAELPAEA